jgi:hypothetical protein
MRSSNRQATAALLIVTIEAAIAHGRRHYSESGEPLATTLAVLECLQREGFVTVEAPET